MSDNDPDDNDLEVLAGEYVLGVVEKADFTSNDKLRAYPPEVVKSSLYAITVEQTGGSPDGKPSGAPVFAGKLIRAVP
jgi:anti-sigma-K factor RskA